MASKRQQKGRANLAQRVQEDLEFYESVQLALALLRAFESSGASDEVVRQLSKDSKPLKEFVAALTGVRRIWNLELSPRAERALRRYGINGPDSVDCLQQLSKEKLQAIRRCGVKTIAEILQKAEEEKSKIKQ